MPNGSALNFQSPQKPRQVDSQRSGRPLPDGSVVATGRMFGAPGSAGAKSEVRRRALPHCGMAAISRAIRPFRQHVKIYTNGE